MRQSRVFPLAVVAVVLCSTLLSVSAAKAQSAAAAVRIVNPIDEKHLVTLKGYTHPLANKTNDRGAAPDDMQLERMHLVLKRSASQETALKQLVSDLHTPGTASYHKWLTPEQFGKQFGPADADIATVSTWLSSHGFAVTKVNPGKQTLEFTGSVAQFRSAFHSQIHKYEVNGESHYAVSSDPQIPEALSPVVGGFVSLNNFRPKNYLHKLGEANYNPKTDRAQPLWTTGPGSGYDTYYDSFVLSPGDYAVQYDLKPLYTAGITGAGQTIAIVNESNINIARVNSFRSLFGLPVNPPQVIIDGNDPGVDGINNPDGPNGASVEAYLDVEWAGAVAPDATIDLVIAGDTALESGLVLAMEHAVYSNVAPVVSLSFGSCELSLGSSNAFLSDLWEEAAAQGITVMVSAGDSGSAGCDDDNTEDYAIYGQAVSGWASTPYNVAVGGTDFYYSTYNDIVSNPTLLDNQLALYWNTTQSNSTPEVSIKQVIPEQPWNDSQYGLTMSTAYQLNAEGTTQATNIAAGSGGASNAAINSNTAGYPKPAWQSGTGVPADGVRDLPDVSLFASNGSNDSYYPICATDGDCQAVSSGETVQIYGVGGTSASAPSFAGIMALVNQEYGPQGQADFVLYPLKAQFPAAFHDVTNGTNSVPCAYDPSSTDCIAVATPYTDANDGTIEGQIGTGTTPEYNATAGYNLATGLGTIDANVLVNDWNKISFASSTTSLSVTPANSAPLSDIPHGTSVTISGTVTPANGKPTPTGDVALMTNSTEPGNQGQTFFTLDSSGNFTGTTSTLPGGTYNVWVHYEGDTSNGPSNSTPVSITVAQDTSGIDFNIFSPTATATTIFTSNSAPGSAVDYGTQFNLSALVAPSTDLANEQTCVISGTNCPVYTSPTGTVTFSDNGSALNTAVINTEGDAEYNAPFAVGSHSVTASYSGDSTYSKATAAAIPFTVVKDTPELLLNFPTLYIYTDPLVGTGQPTVMTFTVLNGAQYSAASSSAIFPSSVAAPTGTLTFTGFPSGVATSATLSSAVDPNSGAVEGVANVVLPATTPSGTYTISVGYSGDSNYNALSASQNSGTVTVVNMNTSSGYGLASTTAATMSGSISPNSTITVTGTVTGQGTVAPTGGVLVYSDGYISAISFSSSTGDVSSFTFTLSSQSLLQGSNLVTIQFLGDANYNPSSVNLNGGNLISNPLSDFTLVPNTTLESISVSGGASSATDTINLSSTNGFNGPVSLTCTATAGITCSIPSSVTLAAGSSTTAALTINAGEYAPNGTYNVEVTGTDSTGEYVHTLGVKTVVSGSVAGSTSFALTNSGNITIDAGATTGNTSTITVTPLGGFTGTVAMTCSVSPSGADSPTCGLASSPLTFGSTAQTDVLTITSSSSTTAGTYTVTVTGTSGSIAPTTTLTVSVSVPSFTLPAASTLSLSAGATTGNTVTLAVTPTNGFTGNVNLSCSVAGPAGANDPATCGITSSVDITSTAAQNATLTITTTAPITTTSMNQPGKSFWPLTGGTALALVLLLGIPSKRRKWMTFFGVLLVALCGAAIGCGGGSSGSGGGTTTIPGTTAGNYVVTVTAKDAATGTITQTTTVTVSVSN